MRLQSAKSTNELLAGKPHELETQPVEVTKPVLAMIVVKIY